MLFYVEIAYTDGEEGYVLGCKTPSVSLEALCESMGINIIGHTLGIGGERVDSDTKISKSCRVEIYPPLRINPIERRKRLVQAKRKNKR